MARYIAFDYGTRRIGIAVTDSGAIVAAPECTCSPEDLPNVLKRLVEAEPCAGFVVGMPGLILGTTTDSTAFPEQRFRTASRGRSVTARKHPN